MSGVGSAVATLMRSADPSTLKARILSALSEAKPRFDRAIAEKDVRGVGNMFLVIDEALLTINPSVRASVGSWDVIDAAHQAASKDFAVWMDMIVTHPDEKFREQCIAKLIWRGEGPILRHWITPAIAQKTSISFESG